MENKKLSWKIRLSIFLSALWLLLLAAISVNDSDGLSIFLTIGVIPLSLLWGTYWALSDSPIATWFKKLNFKTFFLSALTTFAALWVCSSFLFAIGENNESTIGIQMGFLFGFYFPISLILTAIVRPIVRRRFNFSFSEVFILVFVSALSVQSIKSYVESTKLDEGKLFLGDVAKLISLSNSKTELEKYRFSTERPEYLVFLSPLKELTLEVVDARDRYLNVVSDSELSNSLSPESLSNIKKIPSTFTLAKSSLNLYQASIENFFTNIEEAVVTSAINEELKEEFLTGFAKGRKNTEEKLNRFFEVERELFDTFEEIYRLAIKTKPSVDETGSMLIFERQENVDKYNDLIARLNDLSAIESKIMSDLSKDRTQNFKELQKLIKE